MATPEQRFLFGPLEQRVFLLGLRPGQVAVFGVGLVLVLIALWAFPVPVNATAAAVVVGAALVTAFMPVSGRTLEQWAPLVSGWAIGRLAGRHRFRAATPGRGHRSDGTLEVDLPPTLAGVEIVAAPVGSSHEVGRAGRSRSRHLHGAAGGDRGRIPAARVG